MKKNKLVGRKKEIALLEKAFASERPEMIAILGRRRVGKTFLVQTVFEDKITFELSGVQHTPLHEQLNNFLTRFNLQFNNTAQKSKIKSWQEAFSMLIFELEKRDPEDRLIIFLDELPWLASHRSGFLRALSFFWNSWAAKKNVMVILCGSAASWMIQKVVHHKGGLHNRITRRITLNPFNLFETKLFLESKKLFLSDYQVIQLYMAFGGIPHYLDEAESNQSATQIIEETCFKKDGLLTDEFLKLYPALFDNADNHFAVIRALASKKSGMTRAEIIKASKLSNGGGLTRCLQELIYSGFISQYVPFGKSKTKTLFRLTDEYSLFYLEFIEPKRNQVRDVWLHLSQTQKYVSWSGYAFESICLKHAYQIQNALGISGIYAEFSPFYHAADKENDVSGVQIDLLFDRNDNTINIFELKFYKDTFVVTQNLAKGLRDKVSSFKHFSKTKKYVLLNTLSPFGVKENTHSQDLISKSFSIDILFEEDDY